MDRPPPPHVSPKGMWVTKLLFRILSVIFSLSIIGVAAASTVHWDGAWDSVWYASPILILGPPAASALVWDIAEGICIIARRGHRGIHPGAIVAIDLLLWMGFVTGTAWFGVYYAYHDVDYYYSPYYDYDDYYTDHSALQNMSRANLAFGAIGALLHLTLFIFGCYETAIRNRTGPLIVYPGAPPMPPMQPGQNPYGAQPLILPVGQTPPPGFVAVAYGPAQPQSVHQAPQPQEHYAPKAASPPLQEPSPIHTTSSPANGGDWRNSYQPPSSGPYHDTTH